MRRSDRALSRLAGALLRPRLPVPTRYLAPPFGLRDPRAHTRALPEDDAMDDVRAQRHVPHVRAERHDTHPRLLPRREPSLHKASRRRRHCRRVPRREHVVAPLVSLLERTPLRVRHHTIRVGVVVVPLCRRLELSQRHWRRTPRASQGAEEAAAAEEAEWGGGAGRRAGRRARGEPVEGRPDRHVWPAQTAGGSTTARGRQSPLSQVRPRGMVWGRRLLQKIALN
eukprot:2051610-Prymnesium_polylepis.1